MFCGNMGKRKSISPTKRAQIVSLFKDTKLAKREIARRLKISETAVRNAISKFENGDGSSASFRDAPRSGRPIKLDERSVRRLVRIVEQDRRKPARIIRDELSVNAGPRVSVTTIKRNLHKVGLYGRVAVKNPYPKTLKIAFSYRCA